MLHQLHYQIPRLRSLLVLAGMLLTQLLAARTLPAGYGSYVQLQFFNSELTLPAMPEMYMAVPLPYDEESFLQVYSYFTVSEYHPLLKKIGDYRRGMSLSDWHFYDLVARYSEAVFPTAGRNFQVLFQWFMLRKSGIDARLFYTPTEVFLNALTHDIEFGFYLIEQDGARFANLTAKRENLKLESLQAHMPIHQPDSAMLPFTMRLQQLPRISSPDTVERLIEFVHQGNKHQVRVQLNRAWLQLMDDYPYYSQRSYFEVGLSREAENSLLPQLEKLLAGRTDVEKVALLLSFTRTAFFYKDDNGRYGKEKPMTPEQTLYHSYSDCEDRSALFFYLCRKLLRLPEIVLDFDTHVGVAVKLDGVTGDFYQYKGQQFIYCEPTGPQDLLKPGEMWPQVKGQKARILVEYFPE